MAKDSALGKSTEGFASWRQAIPDMPLPVWMILITLGLLVAAGIPAKELVQTFNSGWGMAIGEFALILIPSFTLAAAIDRMRVEGPPLLSVGLSPFAAAGMVCPDTAYAALTPMTRRRRLEIAFGAFAGFKLLFPAGPLIVATGLGVTDGWLLLACAALFVPVYLIGLAYARLFEAAPAAAPGTEARASKGSAGVLVPFAVLTGLLVAGLVLDLSASPVLDFLVNPKGALLAAAVVALAMIAREDRGPCLESGLRRSGSLLVIIGAASALSAALTMVVPIGPVFSGHSGVLALVSLFALTALFKIVQGSSMATFAAVTPIAAPIVAVSGLSPIPAVLAICLGSFIAILPNDSFYWLVRNSALADSGATRATAVLAVGSVVQAAAGLAILLAAYAVLAG